MQRRELPAGWDRNLPVFPTDPKGVAGREASGKVLNVLAQNIPWFLGGSADLGPSNKTTLTFAGAGDLQAASPGGRNVHFGIREHAMGSIMNGLSLSKLRPFGATFFIFSDYARPAIRLSALMELPTVFVFTHDAMGDGEDGPTHQPVEHLASLRAIPGLVTLRPGDANEVVEAYRYIMPLRHQAAVLVLSRQPLPTLDRSKYASAAGVARGAYVLADAPDGRPDVILIATGSEIALAVEAHERLLAEGVRSRVVSMPSWDIFERQPQEYRNASPSRRGDGARRHRTGVNLWMGAVYGLDRARHRHGDVRRLGASQGAADGVRLHGGQRHRRGQGAADRPSTPSVTRRSCRRMTSSRSDRVWGSGESEMADPPHQHGPATSSDATGHAHHAHDAAGADHGVGGHDKHAGHSVEMFRQKFWGTLLLSIPTIVWAPMIQHWFGYEAPGGPVASRWVPAIFGTLVFGYGGWVFIQGAVSEMRDRLPGMMTLISLAITVAFGFSLAVTFGFPGSDLWWELATLVTIMVLGHWVEMRSISQAQGALKELAKLLPDTAVRLVGDRMETVAVSDLRVGDVVLVRPGASIPADGAVRDGSSDVNESMITGESRPVRKDVGARVIAGTVNGSGSLRVEVTGTGDKTALAGIMRLVAQAQSSRSRAQALADRAALLLTVVAIVAAAITLIAWSVAGKDASFVIERVVTVPRDRLSPCAGARHSARGGDLDDARCAQRTADS